MTWAQKKSDSDTLEKKTIFSKISLYKSECLSVFCQLETTVLILPGSNWVQWIQNFVENDLGTKKSDSDKTYFLRGEDFQ